jgi:hypothetical protein
MATSRIERSAENGPGGLPAYRIVFGKTDYLTQGRLSLVAGEIYEASAWIRTVALAGDVRFYCSDKGWSRDVHGPVFPRDTGGKWVRFEKEVTVPASYTDAIRSRSTLLT